MNLDSISIIIPLYNERDYIGNLLKCLDPLADKCEIIFVDGSSTDETTALITMWIEGYCENHPQKRKSDLPLSQPILLTAPERGRANQMNFGASRSMGKILWFLHADSIIPSNSLDLIRDVIGNKIEFGCFKIKFDSTHPIMIFNSIMSNLRVQTRKIAFGDQGIFISRRLFDKIGGFDNVPLMEDYKISEKVRDSEQPLGVAKGVILTSERRYLVRGRLKTMLWMQQLQRRYRAGEYLETLAKEYRENK